MCIVMCPKHSTDLKPLTGQGRSTAGESQPEHLGTSRDVEASGAASSKKRELYVHTYKYIHIRY